MNHRLSLFCISLLLAGCAVGPDYRRPDVDTPAAYKEAGTWKTAQPQDEAARGNWWEIYGDAALNALVPQVEVTNQNVRAAAAQYRQALALLGSARAAYYPTLTGDLTANRAQGTSPSTTGATTVTPGAPIRNTVRPSLTASWEADVWGGIARNVEANESSAQASAADLQAALLSAQATLVQTYMQLRVNDAQQRLLGQTLTAYERSLEITRNRYEAGVAGRVDVAQAEAQLRSTQAQAIDLRAQRAQFEHAIAVLVGKAPANFTLAASAGLPALPATPGGLPSALLERRPDIAGAERRMAAANAQIGVAQAAFFPTLTLGASAGYQNSSFAQLFTLPNRFWSIGPALALTLFDAGARSSQKEAAVAGYDKSVATYRQTVLAAFQEVEDNFAALRVLADEAEAQQAATRAAAEALELTENQYQAGTVSYLNVVTTQAAALAAARADLDVAGRRLVANATLLKALGGSWRP
ncbi:MAG: efflux transporter outer membrane subunit [Rhodocyclaceae bacterium]|nr:efflux transporter outer membrane subunit [Rhodocyclaceae bacterium]